MHQLTRLFPLPTFLFLLALPAFPQAPVVSPGGVVNAADYTQSFSPGMMIAIFGQNLAPATEAAQAVPLPTVLAGVSVEITGGGATVEAPLYFVSTGQINAQVPYGLGGSQVQVRVKNGSGQSDAQTIDVSVASPRFLTKTMDGRGEVILLHLDNSDVSLENPARAGEWVVLYLTGLGAVSPAVEAGQAGGGGSALNRVTGNLELRVNGSTANFNFAGLAPTFVGLYQINFQVPLSAVPGMASISVQIGGSSSQESVTFGCAVAYEQLTSANVGSGGGIVSASGFSAQIPAGALSSDTQIAVHKVTGGTTVSDDPADPVFGLEGIPEDYSGPITITMEVPGDPPIPGEGRLVLIEEGGVGGAVVTDTTVNGSTVTATVQLGDSGAAQSISLLSSARAARGFDTATQGLQLWQYVKKFGHEMSPSGHFDVWYEKKFDPSFAVDIGEALDWGEQQLLGMGYRWKEPERFPISVTVALLDTVGMGVVKRNSRDNTLTMQLPAINPNNVTLEGRRVWWGSVLLKLFHLQYDLHTRLDRLGDATPWTWWHEAARSYFMERLYLTSSFVDHSTRKSNFLFRNPLQLPATNGGAKREAVDDHATGAVNFVRFLDSQKSVGWIQSVLENWAPDNSPVDAMIAADIDVSEEWLEFCRKFSEGAFDAYIPNQSNTAEVMNKRSLVNSYRLGDENSLPKTVSWDTGRDLMAEVYRFTVAHGWEAGSSLLVSLPSGGSDLVARVFEDDNPNGSPSPQFLGEIAAGAVLEIPDFDQYQGTSLVVMLINKRAVRPYNGVTPAQLRLEIKEGEESEVVGWLRQCKKVIVNLRGSKMNCYAPDDDSSTCGFGSTITIRSWSDSTTDTLLGIEWSGRSFSWGGTIYQPGVGLAKKEYFGSGTMAEDGMSFEGGTFRETTFNENGGKSIWELKIAGPLPWAGVTKPFEGQKSYSYRVDGPVEVPQHVVEAIYSYYNSDGSLNKELTTMEYTLPDSNLYITFSKE